MRGYVSHGRQVCEKTIDAKMLLTSSYIWPSVAFKKDSTPFSGRGNKCDTMAAKRQLTPPASPEPCTASHDKMDDDAWRPVPPLIPIPDETFADGKVYNVLPPTEISAEEEWVANEEKELRERNSEKARRQDEGLSHAKEPKRDTTMKTRYHTRNVQTGVKDNHLSVTIEEQRQCATRSRGMQKPTHVLFPMAILPWEGGPMYYADYGDLTYGALPMHMP